MTAGLLLRALVAFAIIAGAAVRAADAPPETNDVSIFMEKWKPLWEEQGLAAFGKIPQDTNTLALILAALQKEPGGIWCWALQMFYLTRLPLDQPEATGAFESWKTAHSVVARAAGNKPTSTLDHKLRMTEENLARAALETRTNLATARQMSERLLARAGSDTNSWDYGNLLFAGHTLLGRLALREGKLQEARQELLQSGQTPGSPQLNSFGPTMELAKELLERGGSENRKAVLEFLDQIAQFWANPEKATATRTESVSRRTKEIEAWKEQIRTGEIPTGPKWR